VRSLLAFFAYAAKAVSKINRKREDESVVEGIWDMVVVVGGQRERSWVERNEGISASCLPHHGCVLGMDVRRAEVLTRKL
jgi:hypothetical protein